MSAGGFEPPTNGLKGHCSAVELRARRCLRQLRSEAVLHLTEFAKTKISELHDLERRL